MTGHGGQVGLGDGAVLELDGQACLGRVVLGYDDQPRRILVQAVHQTRPDLASDALEVGAMGQHGVGEGVVRVARRGVGHEARGLVDHEQVRVLVHDVQVHGLGDKGGGHRRGNDEAHGLALSQPGGRFRGSAVYGDAALGGEGLNAGARQVGTALGQEGVEPLTRLVNPERECHRGRRAGAGRLATGYRQFLSMRQGMDSRPVSSTGQAFRRNDGCGRLRVRPGRAPGE